MEGGEGEPQSIAVSSFLVENLGQRCLDKERIHLNTICIITAQLYCCTKTEPYSM